MLELAFQTWNDLWSHQEAFVEWSASMVTSIRIVDKYTTFNLAYGFIDDQGS
jgi:hypothetical protein